MDKKITGTSSPITSFLMLGAAALALNLMKYTSASGNTTSFLNYHITGTDAYWRIPQEKNKWVLLRGADFLSIYNQVYHNQLLMGIGPTFYYSTIKAPIL